jgi:hypothetical protein
VNCRNCGTELPPGAMFCGECGTTVAVPKGAAAPKLVEPTTRARPGDTAVIQPLVPSARTSPAASQATTPVEPAPPTTPIPRITVPRPLPMPPAAEVAPVSAAAVVPPAPVATPADSEDDHDDVEKTRLVRNRQGGERFVLQFSTGENTTVYGTGLIGRNPLLQPGEFVDQLVTIVDPGKSVSKTHLEFGQTSGVFWVSDRFSANGTVVRPPDARPQRLDAGKRQPVVRGTRIDIGEQFFVVS